MDSWKSLLNYYKQKWNFPINKTEMTVIYYYIQVRWTTVHVAVTYDVVYNTPVWQSLLNKDYLRNRTNMNICLGIFEKQMYNWSYKEDVGPQGFLIFFYYHSKSGLWLFIQPHSFWTHRTPWPGSGRWSDSVSAAFRQPLGTVVLP